jgi:glycerol kinase
MHAILAIDQGTHASRAVLFNKLGKTVAGAYQPVTMTRTGQDVYEQDANEILDSVWKVIGAALAANNLPVSSAALATQRSTLVAWDGASGEPLAPAISWLDRRSASELQAFHGHEPRIRHITGTCAIS